MSLISFIERFPDEESCKQEFKRIRDKQGIVCNKCGHTEHYWLKNKDQYECKSYRSRMTLRSGGSQAQAKVLVMVSSKVSMDKNKKLDKYQKPTQLKFIKMLVIEDLKGETIMEKVKSNISKETWKY